MLLATLLAYLRCLGNGFVYDDRLMIAENRYIGSGSFIWKSLTRDLWWFRGPAHLPRSAQYHPLQDIWLALNYALFGLNPLGWHVTIVALHLLVVALVFKVAERLTGQWQAALLAAMLFGVLADPCRSGGLAGWNPARAERRLPTGGVLPADRKCPRRAELGAGSGPLRRSAGQPRERNRLPGPGSGLGVLARAAPHSGRR